MALNTLTQLSEKKGINLLEKEVIITEKLDTFRLLFENTSDGIRFFKKDGKSIDLIERTLNNVWEDALLEIETLIHDIDIPVGLTFGVAYTPAEKPIRIPYYNMPKYVLTDITRKKDGKVVESLSVDEVEQWSGMIRMARPPVIFKGKLTEEQLTVISSYDKGNYDEINEDRFSELLENMFGKTYSGEEVIEGIVMRSDDYICQVKSYEFEILNEAYEKSKGNKDFYDLTLMLLNEYLNANFTIPVLEADTPEASYIETVNHVFNGFMEWRPSLREELDEKYLRAPHFGYMGKLNRRFIKNEKTLTLLGEDPVLESLYKVLLTSLRKKKRPSGLLNESFVSSFNTFVYLINENVKGKIDEDEIQAINESRSENVVVKEVNKRKYSDIDNMRVIASIQSTFDTTSETVKRGNKPCAVYIIDPKPLTNSVKENIENIQRVWKMPVLLGSVQNKKRMKGDSFTFSDNIKKSQLEAFGDFNKERVPAFFMLDSYDLREMFEYLRPDWEPRVLITEKDRKADMVIQLYFEEEVMGGRLNVDEKFNIGEMEDRLKLTAYRAIEDDLFYSFKEVTPQSVWGLYDMMSSEYKTWAGKILTI
jgi:hypothetical protein